MIITRSRWWVLENSPPDTISVPIYYFSLACKTFWKGKKWVINAPVNEWILAILRMQTPPWRSFMKIP